MLTVLFLAQVLLPGVSYAQGVSVVVDGEAVELTDAAREINGRLFLPMRALFETLGAEVSWDAETQTAVGRLGKRAAEFIEGTHIYIKTWSFDNYGCIKLDAGATPCMIEDRLYLPVRTVAEGLGCKVRWDSVSRTVYMEKIEPREDVDVYVEVIFNTGRSTNTATLRWMRVQSPK
ncbi:copper amine oxidase N-terminal domain-containing protein [Koleobacter methoxysyntrophicus]|nr:copper amine oxidase N-terminal domain-containing protein [Koleobacter methoxysyntrophicus]